MFNGMSGSSIKNDSNLSTSSSTAPTNLKSIGTSLFSIFSISSSSLISFSEAESSSPSSSSEASSSASPSSSYCWTSWISSSSWDSSSYWSASSTSSSFISNISRSAGTSSESYKVDLYGILVLAAFLCLSSQSTKFWAHAYHCFSPLDFLSGKLLAGCGGKPGPLAPASENLSKLISESS